MRNSIKKIYFIETIIVAISIFLSILLFVNNILYEYLNVIIWTILSLIILSIYRFPRDKSYFKNTTLRLVVISLLSYLIIIYSAGLFTGFSKSIYAHTLKVLIRNITPVIILIFSEEYIRYIISKNTESTKKPIILLTIIYILQELIVLIKYYNFYNAEQIFIFICLFAVSTIANHATYSYLTYNVGFTPALTLRLAIDVYPYLLPFYPDLGNYISSVVKLILPFTVYYSVAKTLKYKEKSRQYTNSLSKKIILTPMFTLLLIIIILVSGIFDIKMIAIGSNSMTPVYVRGDAVIYEKIKPQHASLKVKVGDILVFDRNGTVMTHRVIKIRKENNEVYYSTKGDFNKDPDRFESSYENVLGRVKFVVKYIGFPTVKLNEFLNDR